jgi:hypothetical protein
MKCLKVLVAVMVLPQFALAQATQGVPGASALKDLVNVASSAYLQGFVAASASPMTPSIDPAALRGDAGKAVSESRALANVVMISSLVAIGGGSTVFLRGLGNNSSKLKWIGAGLFIGGIVGLVLSANPEHIRPIEKTAIFNASQFEELASIRAKFVASAYGLSSQKERLLRDHFLTALQVGKIELDQEVLSSSYVLSAQEVEIFVKKISPALIQSAASAPKEALFASESDPVGFANGVAKELGNLKAACGQDSNCSMKVSKQLQRVNRALAVVNQG